MKNILILGICALLAVSCTKNYPKELGKLVAKCQKESKPVIAVSQVKHFVIYKEGDAFWIDNLDEPAHEILSANKKMERKSYWMMFDDNGTPHVKVEESFREMELGKGFFGRNESTKNTVGYVYPYTESNIKLVNDEVLTFTYSEVFEDRGGDNFTSKSQYVYYLSNPNTFFESQISPIMNEDGSRKDRVKSSAGSLADAILPVFEGDEIFPYRSNAEAAIAGYFEWNFMVDKSGNVINKDECLYYKNDIYNKRMVYNLSEFATKRKATNVLKAINDTIKYCQIREYVNQVQKEAVPIYEIAKAYNNQIAANKKYKNKIVTVECTLDQLVKPDIFNSKYKYKMRSEYAQFFSVNYNIAAYTDDEKFMELTYPAKVVMRAKLVYGSQTDFYFEDCELLLW